MSVLAYVILDTQSYLRHIGLNHARLDTIAIHSWTSTSLAYFMSRAIFGFSEMVVITDYTMLLSVLF
jgi:hypothetical protein